MATLAFNGLSLDVKVLHLVVLGSKCIPAFEKIRRNPYAWSIPNVPIVLQSATATKNRDNATLLKECSYRFEHFSN